MLLIVTVTNQLLIMEKSYVLSVTIPAVMMFVIVLFSAYVSYKASDGPWVRAFYINGDDAFVKGSQHAKAIIDSQNNIATMYAPEENEKEALTLSGALLFDPKGLPLCLRP